MVLVRYIQRPHSLYLVRVQRRLFKVEGGVVTGVYRVDGCVGVWVDGCVGDTAYTCLYLLLLLQLPLLQIHLLFSTLHFLFCFLNYCTFTFSLPPPPILPLFHSLPFALLSYHHIFLITLYHKSTCTLVLSLLTFILLLFTFFISQSHSGLRRFLFSLHV